MALAPQIQGEINRSSSRMVWVLNLDPFRSYKADYQGVKITVPPAGEKVPKHVRDGGNMMEYLAARKFITDYKQPQEYVDGVPQFFPKMLIDKELTDEEYEKILNKTASDLKKEAVVENKKAARKLSKALADSPVRNKVSLAEQETPEG